MTWADDVSDEQFLDEVPTPSAGDVTGVADRGEL
jgi:hypothetical protein